jgi:hypothetical protein
VPGSAGLLRDKLMTPQRPQSREREPLKSQYKAAMKMADSRKTVPNGPANWSTW